MSMNTKRQPPTAAYRAWQAKEKATRAAQVADRRGLRDARSPKEQLAVLDRRLGPGVGAVKERARLSAQIATTPIEAPKERYRLGKK